MGNTNSKSTETTTQTAQIAPAIAASPVIAALAAAKAAKKAQDDAEHEQRKLVHGAQQAAREVLGQGISDLAKLCRQFVSAQGTDAAEKTTALVGQLMATVTKASH